MKICIPTEDNKGLEARVYGHFGSAPYFTIYDAEQNTLETIANHNQHHAHGMCQPMSGIIGKNIDIVICGGMGLRAVQKLNDAGICAYKASGETVSQIIERFKKSELEEITVSNACGQHGCH